MSKPEKFEDQRNDEQKRGADGTCATVKLKDGRIINAHEYNAEKHGPYAEHREASGPATQEEQKATLAEAPKGTPVDWTKKTVPELKEHLADKGISFDTSAKKDDLVALCVANP